MRQLLAETCQRLLEDFAVIVVVPAEHCLSVPDLAEDALARGRAALRAARVVTVIADVAAALIVELAAALVLRVVGAALITGVGPNLLIIVEAVAVVLVEPPRMTPLAAEGGILAVERIAVNAAVDALMAVVAARGIV